jgi:hypothetical protein
MAPARVEWPIEARDSGSFSLEANGFAALEGFQVASRDTEAALAHWSPSTDGSLNTNRAAPRLRAKGKVVALRAERSESARLVRLKQKVVRRARPRVGAIVDGGH